MPPRPDEREAHALPRSALARLAELASGFPCVPTRDNTPDSPYNAGNRLGEPHPAPEAERLHASSGRSPRDYRRECYLAGLSASVARMVAG